MIFFVKISKNKIYDIIFIDGLYLYEQSLRDINNSLNHLSINGSIVLHDCNPLSKESQNKKRRKLKKWHGDVWKVFSILRMTRKDLNMYVVNVNHGCGIVQRGKL